MIKVFSPAPLAVLLQIRNDAGDVPKLTRRFRAGFQIQLQDSVDSLAVYADDQLVFVTGSYPGDGEDELWFMPGPAIDKHIFTARRLASAFIKNLSPPDVPLISYVRTDIPSARRLALIFGMKKQPDIYNIAGVEVEKWRVR